MADPPDERRDRTVECPPLPELRATDERDAEAPRPVALTLLLTVGAAMVALVAGLVWSTGRSLQWW